MTWRSVARRPGGLAPALVPVLVVALVALSACGPVTDPAPTPSTTTSPARSALDPGELRRIVDEGIAGGSVSLAAIGAVSVSVAGRTVLAEHRNGTRPTDAFHVWSVSKSVASALVGIAIDDGLISGPDARLPELLPEHRARMTAEMQTITLRQLMDMSAGFPPDGVAPFTTIHDVFRAPDATRFVLERGLVNPPGAVFDYSSSASHLVTAALAAALRRADGPRPRSVLAYARERLFTPLQIDTTDAFSAPVELPTTTAYERGGFGWGTDKLGVHSGCCLLRLRAADLVKLGELYLGNGEWRGRRILPAAWVQESLRPSAMSSGYGLMWWLQISPSGQPAFSASGHGGQLIAVFPERQAVVVIASVDDGETTMTPDDAWAFVSATIFPALE